MLQDEKGKNFNALSIAPEQEEFEKKCSENKIGRGHILTVRISKGKNRIYKKRIITDILRIDEPKQLDLEHFI